jgi:hypothetical protein
MLAAALIQQVPNLQFEKGTTMKNQALRQVSVAFWIGLLCGFAAAFQSQAQPQPTYRQEPYLGETVVNE